MKNETQHPAKGPAIPTSPMPAARIEKPTLFAEWIKTKKLFDDGATKTETFVTDGHEEGIRYAYGKSSEGWHFFIAMTPAEEPAFWQVYRERLKRNRQPENRHVAIVNFARPPNCGTPNTPPCEGEAITSLPAPNAGPGVTWRRRRMGA